MKLKPAYVYLAVAVALLMGWFYWYEYRPERAKRDCAAFFTELAAKEWTDAVSQMRHYQQLCEDLGSLEEFGQAFQRGIADREPAIECAINSETGEC